MPPKARARTHAALVSDSASSVSTTDDDDYRQKRDRNNVAVKKSREKSRQRARETAEKMDRLRRENDELEQRTVELAAELRTLKDLLLSRAARRGVAKDDKPPLTSPSQEPVRADAQTVCIDHEYTSNS